jgi:hypothetical protein
MTDGSAPALPPATFAEVTEENMGKGQEEVCLTH